MRGKLYLVMATAGELSQKERLGFIGRFRKQVDFYKKHFDVTVFSSDRKNYTAYLGARHVTFPIPRIPAAKHLLYYIFLLLSSAFFRKGVIRTFGVANPLLPAMRLISGNRIAASYHYDWVEQERLHHGFLKYLAARATEKLSMLGVDRVLATTDRLARKIRRKYGKRTDVIPNFVDETTFRPVGRKRMQIIFVGRLHWLKGIDVLLEAVSLADKNIKVLIAGEGTERQKLERMAESLGLRNVSFLGSLPQSRLASLISESCALVLPTLTMEGHPKVVIESFACGTPCIVTNVLGSREIVKHGVTGLIVKPGDAAGLASAIKRMVSDKPLRERMSSAALKEAEKYFFENVMEREVAILKEMSGQ